MLEDRGVVDDVSIDTLASLEQADLHTRQRIDGH